VILLQARSFGYYQKAAEVFPRRLFLLGYSPTCRRFAGVVNEAEGMPMVAFCYGLKEGIFNWP
jgi:hypothetical protein